MKTLIIPDIHNRVIKAQAIIDKEPHDRIVFLGDYFDNFDDDTLEPARQTAEWLKESLKDPKRTHLIGNHDLGYIVNDYETCAGFSQAKKWAIQMTGIDFSQMKYYCWVGDWLCTHAGLTKQYMINLNHKNLSISEFLDDLEENYPHRLRAVSSYRGGKDAHSGILWCDYDEFESISNIKQIFGHTHGTVRRINNNICIDTWLDYYAVYDTKTKKMVVKKNG